MASSKSTKRRRHEKARRNFERAECICIPAGRKVRHSSRRRALQAGFTLQAHNDNIPSLRVYKCAHCKDWHFTSQMMDPADNDTERV